MPRERFGNYNDHIPKLSEMSEKRVAKIMQARIERPMPPLDLELRESGVNLVSMKPEPTPTFTESTDDKDSVREFEAEVGVTTDVLEAFAEEQRRAPANNRYALLDEQFPPANPNAPKDIIADDYSEDSRP